MHVDMILRHECRKNKLFAFWERWQFNTKTVKIPGHIRALDWIRHRFLSKIWTILFVGYIFHELGTKTDLRKFFFLNYTWSDWEERQEKFP